MVAVLALAAVTGLVFDFAKTTVNGIAPSDKGLE